MLDYINDEGQWVEPKYYVPVLPMILVNGAAGIGTGWSTAVCMEPAWRTPPRPPRPPPPPVRTSPPSQVWPHHPLAVLDACSAVLRGEPPPPLRPWASAPL